MVRRLRRGGVVPSMVTLECKAQRSGLKSQIGRTLQPNPPDDLVLALPKLRRVEVVDYQSPEATWDYHHLPSTFKSVDFKLCIELDERDHSLIRKYQKNMPIIYVDQVSEAVVINDEEIYFEQGVTSRSDIIEDTANWCEYNCSIEECVEWLFEVQDIDR